MQTPVAPTAMENRFGRRSLDFYFILTQILYISDCISLSKGKWNLKALVR